MRLILAAALLSTAAIPALAQDQDGYSRDQAQKAARALQNPIVQEGLASVLGNLTGIVLDTRIGPLARYADPEDDIRPNDTLGSLQRRRDPGFEARMHRDTRRAIGAAGAATEDALAMGAALEDTTARLRAALAPLARALDSYGDN